jgi:prepilin-type N-terminal cleavage/methylation domain-containing protein
MSSSNRSTRHGLTLIELVVVMVILVALAGLLVPTFSAMLTRSHTSTCSTNIGELNKAIQEYQQLYGRYPNNMDSLTDGTTLITYLAGGSLLPASAGGPGTNQAGGQITHITLTDADVAALGNAGLATVQRMATTPHDPTFDYYPSASPATDQATIATGTVLAGIDPTATSNTADVTLCQKLNLPLTGRYVVLGIGPRCDMIGKTIATAPVHYGDTVPLNPEYGYQRLVGVFKISDSALNFTTAILVAAGPIHDNGLGTIDDELQNWYQLQNNGT